jgi:flagellar basal body-associated protein FliL
LARALNVVLVLAVLAAAAVAFVIAEGAKLQKSPLEKTAVSKVFSPDATITRIVADGKVTRYGHKVAAISFQLRSAQTLEIWVEDAHGDQVARCCRRATSARDRSSASSGTAPNRTGSRRLTGSTGPS